ncbi:hypothetical protein [Oceaniglobus trochenteri]|uniref:hypothetical protein n=1 Tax=Oceaniglobus trochenteri TaxID=2763260 RepID=UPI001CFF8774|nr:hypothetical protein [Oceaniglobus trochenteri]
MNRDTLVAMLLAGAAATVAFDIWGQALAPMLGLGNLAPEGLARSLLGKLGLPNGRPAGHVMHLVLVGLIAYPLGWMVVFRPIQQRVMPGLHRFAASAIYGFGLWVVAIGGIAGFATGDIFLNFTKIAWVALVGHVLYGVVLVAALSWLARRRA